MKIKKYILAIFIFPFCLKAQTAKFPGKTDLETTYTQAISDFIIAANKKNKSHFDTIFFGKRRNNQEDDFPDIELPKVIANTQIRLIKPELGAKKQKEIQSNIYINMMGWLNSKHAEFIFVVFSHGFKHQYDYYINYQYKVQTKSFELEKIEFKGPPFTK
jgi:hypothetical protein